MKETYGLHSNKYYEILNLKFWEKSLVTRRFSLDSNSRGTDEIKGLPNSIDFRYRNTEKLHLFSIISIFIQSCNFSLKIRSMRLTYESFQRTPFPEGLQTLVLRYSNLLSEIREPFSTYDPSRQIPELSRENFFT